MESFNSGKANNLNMNRGSMIHALGNVDPDGKKELSYSELERRFQEK